jgi:ParB family chromosome partitioning protein
MTDIKLTQIVNSETNPRTICNKERFAEFVASIKKHGILEPVIVREHKTAPNRFELVAGSRRLLAALELKLPTIPAVIKDLSDSEVLEIQIIENVQREDLTPLEEARGYKALIDVCKYKQADIADKIGKSQGYVAARLALLDLRADFQLRIEEGKLMPGHAKYLMTLAGCDGLLDRVSKKLKEHKETLTVKEFEDIVDDVIMTSSKCMSTGDYSNSVEFNTKDCKACEFYRDIKNWRGKEKRCFNLDCWSKKQLAAKKVKSERIREKVKKGQIVKEDELPKNCKHFEHAQFDKAGCKGCEHRKATRVTEYGGKKVTKEICLDAECFGKKEKEAQELYNKENEVRRLEKIKKVMNQAAKTKVDRNFWAEMLANTVSHGWINPSYHALIDAYGLMMEVSEWSTEKKALEYFTRNKDLNLEEMFIFTTLWKD